MISSRKSYNNAVIMSIRPILHPRLTPTSNRYLYNQDFIIAANTLYKIDIFFFFPAVSYLSYFVFQNITIQIFFLLKTSQTCDYLTIFCCKCELVSLILDWKVSLNLHILFLIWSIRAINLKFDHILLIFLFVIYIELHILSFETIYIWNWVWEICG